MDFERLARLDLEPGRTIDHDTFEKAREAIRFVTSVAGASDDEVTIARPESDYSDTKYFDYSVSEYEGPHGLVILTIAWCEGSNYLSLNVRNDVGPEPTIAGIKLKTKRSEPGHILDYQEIESDELAWETKHMYRLATSSAFGTKPKSYSIFL